MQNAVLKLYQGRGAQISAPSAGWKSPKETELCFLQHFTACESNFWGNLDIQIFPWTVIFFFFNEGQITHHLSSGSLGCGGCAQSDLLPAPVTCSTPPSIPAQTHPKRVRLWLLEVHVTFFLILFSQPLGCLACFSASLFSQLLQPLIKSCKNNTWITFEEVCLWMRCQTQDGDV